jgi:hypothetical protein
MRKIVIGMHAGMAGTDDWEFYEVPDDVTDEELGDFAWQLAVQHAETYGIYPLSEYVDNEDISDEELDSDSYSDNIEGWYEEYDPKKHDGHSMNGIPNWQDY